MDSSRLSHINHSQQSINNIDYLASNKADLVKYDCPEFVFPFDGEKCAGPKWRHGHIPCQKGNLLSLATTVVQWGRERGVFFNRLCRDCHHLYKNIQTWIRTTRMNEHGIAICGWSILCENLVEDWRAQCATHYRRLFPYEQSSRDIINYWRELMTMFPLVSCIVRRD
jgi:hypothetical protein